MHKMYIPTKLLYGKGALESLHLENIEFKKALICLTNGKSVIKFGYLDKLIKELEILNITYVIFNEIESNPTKDNVMKGAKVAKDNDCDVIIAIGGGSCIDCAKSIACMVSNDGDYWDYINGGSGKAKALKKPPLPVIAITTTAGTGSEIDPWTVITNKDEKIGYGNDLTYPLISIVDPLLTMSVPLSFTIYQAFDALFHSLEGYININHTYITDAFSLHAIRLISKHLPIVIKDLSNYEAREALSYANTLSGMNESTSGCTGEHSIEHALSGYKPNLAHGKGLIIITMAYFNKLVKSNVCNDRFIELAIALGKKDATKKEDFLEVLYNLLKTCGVEKLDLYSEGFKEEELLSMAIHSLNTMQGCFSVDPFRFTKEDVYEVLKESYRK